RRLERGLVLQRRTRKESPMRRLTTLLTAVFVAGALAMPAMADAQAQRRGGGSSGGSSSGGSASSGGSSRGGSVAVPRASAPRPPPPAVRRAPARPRSSPVRVSGSSGAGASSAAVRSRDNQAIRGTAVPRGSVAPAPRPPIDYDYYRWYSWYPSTSWGYGYFGYSPWRYGYGPWCWHRYGWYDPFWYGPWSFGYGATYWPSGGVNYDDDYDVAYEDTTGSIRLRVNPESARVYVDGALVGVADEFGGLSNHLELPAGR